MEAESYEAQRQANIAANFALLQSLGLSSNKATKTPIKRVPKPKSSNEPSRRSARVKSANAFYAEFSPLNTPQQGRRRRKRSDSFLSDEDDDPVAAKDDDTEYRMGISFRRISPTFRLLRRAQRLGQREQDPKQFGHIPGVAVGAWWPTRMECSTDAVHAPTVAGISGSAEEGCYSLALSGGYDDDIDLGDRFTYTGSGGRKLQGFVNGKRINLRTAPQTFDQSFKDKCNAALLTSSKTRKPIRVIRGYKGSSQWTPLAGYLYCGLYVCTRAWYARGLSGFKVCKYAFERVEDQDPLPEPDRSDSVESSSCSSSSVECVTPIHLTPRCDYSKCLVEVVITVDSKSPLYRKFPLCET